MCVVADGVLSFVGAVEEAGDLDVLARGAAWGQAQELERIEHLQEWGATVANMGSCIAVGTRWAIGEVDSDALIDGAELFAGLPFASLGAVVAYRRISDRPKDPAHIEIIERRLHGR
jgi:hypothetical protein